MYSRLLIICFAAFLVSCAQKVSSIKNDVDVPLDENMGYLLIGVETNLTLSRISISGEKYLKLSSEDLRRGSQFILVDVPAGEYSIDKIQLFGNFRTKLENGYWNFSVSPSVISYVGHLNVKTLSLWPLVTQVELQNRSSEALEFLEDSFPNILSNRTIVYQGPGTDPFLQFALEETE